MCDFIMREGTAIVDAIQVTISIKEPATRERELKGLLAAMNKYQLSEGTIITLEDEEEITVNDRQRISIRPVWKWLLQ